MTKTAIVWLRNDLRLEDNPALHFAAKNYEQVIPVYISAPNEDGDWPLGGASKVWLHHSLQSLKESFDERGLKLILRKGSSLHELQTLIKETKADALFWNRRYEPEIIQRDKEIKSTLQDLLTVESFNASLLFEPWTVANKQGKPFQVFTPFWKHCQTYLDVPLPLPTPHFLQHKFNLNELNLNELNLLPKIHWDRQINTDWEFGENAAKHKLKAFIKHNIKDYKIERDRPDHQGVSKLSPHLHFGEISPRQIWHAIKSADEQVDERESTQTYLNEIGWREFGYHLLYHFPETPLIPLKKDFLHFAWEKNKKHLDAWQKGQTGYPIIDAAMRQLWQTGWMHNRSRMIVGSFLVKNLLISWVEGAKWFWDTLLDADLASNTLGWQWVGGCGADAAPYFRVFNPLLQGEKFDPEGEYVRKFVPELKALPSEWIHKPWEAPAHLLQEYGITLGKTYPFPIVDLKKSRAKALEVYKTR